MSDVLKQFHLDTRPVADPRAVVSAGRARFTVLTSRLIRMEYHPESRFEDRASQAFWYRQQEVPPYTTRSEGGQLIIDTDHLTLTCAVSDAPFSADTLSVTLKTSGTVWRYGDANPHNLKGTWRTLDNADGATRLEPGLLSRAGWSVIDDSRSLVFNADSWLETRDAPADNVDLYFFGHGDDYQACLNDYLLVTGKIPLLPRWVLGNWWSRYWAYTQPELTGLMQDFRANHVPLSVCIVDMDWHITQTGNSSSGWTGYTWNKELFPNPKEFIDFLHGEGLKTALNLHPADGVHPHEEAYPAVARHMGIDPESGTPVPFDLTDPRFAQAYFELLHHPHEATGIDFWWIDWQQGEKSRLPGLDPLWWLNHLHFYDLGRDGTKRPFIFSRWGGYGNHRYPIGFSGDTWVTWESLAFQPFFTATAANVGYGWWSHDIGGHIAGIEEPELYVRWVQYGVFSPIFRLHCTNNPFHERRPWGWNSAEVLRLSRDAMQLRHALIPYLYTMSWRSHTDNLQPIRPMYHDYPDREEAYHCPDQYTFGTELIAAPYLQPADNETGMSRQVVWLPEGDWYHFFSGEYHQGDRWYARYGTLEDVPVFAKAGAIVPLGARTGWGGVENPASLDVHIFAGASNRFTLYEDDGETLNYREGQFCLTQFTQEWLDDTLRFDISATTGITRLIPQERRYRLFIYGVHENANVEVNGSHHAHYSDTLGAWCVSLEPHSIREPLTLTLTSTDGSLLGRTDRTDRTLIEMIRQFRMPAMVKPTLVRRLDAIRQNPAAIEEFDLYLTDRQKQALLEVLHGVGIHETYNAHYQRAFVLWNTHGKEGFTYRHTQTNSRYLMVDARYNSHADAVPRFIAVTPDTSEAAWSVTASYFDLFRVGGGKAGQ